MPVMKHSVEKIIVELREIEKVTAQGMWMPMAARKVGPPIRPSIAAIAGGPGTVRSRRRPNDCSGSKKLMPLKGRHERRGKTPNRRTTGAQTRTPAFPFSRNRESLRNCLGREPSAVREFSERPLSHSRSAKINRELMPS